MAGRKAISVGSLAGSYDSVTYVGALVIHGQGLVSTGLQMYASHMRLITTT